MVIPNFHLPQIELPTVEILDDDDNEILAAFEVIFNGYKRAQSRTRAITKAYGELLSTTRDILKEYELVKNFSKNKNEKPIVDKIPTHRHETSQHQETAVNVGPHDTEMIDLTTLFVKRERPGESTSRDKSPEMFLETCKQSPEKQMSRVQSVKNDSKRKLDIEIESGKDRMENQADNEENVPPFKEKNLNSNDSFSLHNEFRPPAKISLSKDIYNFERNKISGGKSMKQATLVFQPIVAKTNLTLLPEKQTNDTPDVVFCGSNLFEENYHSIKKNSDSIERIRSKDNDRCDKQDFPVFVTEKPEIDATARKDAKREEKSVKKNDDELLIPSASQIDETARSLFDDEDPDDFPNSPDILNTCVESPVRNVFSQSDVNNDTPKTAGKCEPVASTSKLRRFHHSMESMDETFFAPAEKIAPRNNVNERTSAGCSKISEVKDRSDNIRSVKRKAEEECLDTQKEFENLALQEINWDVDVTEDEWISPKRLCNNSFDYPPEKTKKSLEYAHLAKTERNKAKRSKLRGWDCWECEKYYKNMDLPEKEIIKRMNACSRHRSKYNPRYYTPKGFWNPEFPETDSSGCSENEHP